MGASGGSPRGAASAAASAASAAAAAPHRAADEDLLWDRVARDRNGHHLVVARAARQLAAVVAAGTPSRRAERGRAAAMGSEGE